MGYLAWCAKWRSSSKVPIDWTIKRWTILRMALESWSKFLTAMLAPKSRSKCEWVAGAYLDEISIFSQPWFVDIAYRKKLRVAKAFNKVGKPICVFPYCQTNVMGIFPRITSSDNWRRLSSFVFLDKHINDEEKRDAITDIIKQLPRSIGYCQFIMDSDSGIIRDAFVKAGFECIEMPKYIRPPNKQNYQGTDAYAQARDNVLKTISKDGRARYKITAGQAKIEKISASDFCKFYESNLIGKGEQSYAPLSVAEILIENCVRRQKAFALAVNDKDGMEAAAAFLFDSGTIYAWLATRKYHPQSTKFSGDDKYKKYCIDLLTVEAMIFAEAHGLIYDAEIIPVERNGALRNPHRVFVNEKILHLSKEESRFLFERMGWWYLGARQVFCKARDVFAKRLVDMSLPRALAAASAALMRSLMRRRSCSATNAMMPIGVRHVGGRVGESGTGDRNVSTVA